MDERRESIPSVSVPPSTQKHYVGQRGWNDLGPEALPVVSDVRRGSGSRRPRRVVSPYPGSPMSSTTSLSSMGGTTAPPPAAVSSDSLLLPQSKLSNSTSESEAHSSRLAKVDLEGPRIACVDPKEVLRNIDELFKVCNLPEKDCKQSLVRLQKIVPTLESSSLSVLNSALIEPNRRVAREQLIQYSLQVSGTSGWALPIRRALESCP